MVRSDGDAGVDVQLMVAESFGDASVEPAWWQVELAPAAATLAAVEDWCWAQGALSVTCVPGQDAAEVLEPDPGATPIWSDTQLQVLFDADETEIELRARLTAAWSMSGTPAPHWQVLPLRNEDWQSSWRQHVQTRCFGERLWVQTRDAPAPAHGVAVLLDPGLAFGTGGHPTTGLCLTWLATQLPANRDVIDFGCGSGILAIAAAKLGANVVYALDHDPQALRATSDNAQVNGVAARLKVMSDATLPAQCCDVLLANILSQTLVALAPTFTRLLRPGGWLVMSGVLAHQAATVRVAFAQFDFLADQSDQDWVCLIGQRR